MVITDRIYGRFNVKEEVLIELLKSKPVQRLKKISQFGIPNKYYFVKGFSRYEHSVGVMLLLKKLNAPVEEQVAGLLHDVSHYAFSHVIDWILDNAENEDFQDKILAKFINESEIKPILKKYGFNYKNISDLPRYQLLEQEVPELCADRLDYIFREFEIWSNRKNLEYCLGRIKAMDNTIVFTNKRAAQIFGRFFIKCQSKHWAGLFAVRAYHHFSNFLKIALEKGIISMNDFLKDEETIISKLEKNRDPEIITLFKSFKTKQYFNQKIGTDMKKKLRYADPKYIEKGRIIRLSQTDNSFKLAIDKLLRTNVKGF